jgi:hypothetical protein
LEILTIELVFGILWYYMYFPFLINHIILFGDLGVPNLNSGIMSQFFSVSPNYSGVLFTFIYHYDEGILPAVWDYYLLLVPFLTPLGFYYLMKSMDFKSLTRVIATLFYSVNPIVIIFGISGLEYTGLFFFFPIILAFIIKYHVSSNIQNLVNAAILTFVLFLFLGTDYLKFVIFVLLGIILMDLLFSGRVSIFRKLKSYIAWLVLIVVISMPMLLSLISSTSLFSHAASTDMSTVSSLMVITRFEYAASNLGVSLYALPYVANQLTSLNYENTWFGALYIFIILFSLASVLKYRGKYRKVYYTLFIVLLLLILFQYGVYNGTFIDLYARIPLLGLYNYPLFMNISQLLIYVMFFAISYECVADYLANRTGKLRRLKRVLAPAFAVIFVVLIIVSSVPVINYEHNTNASFARNSEVPSYALNLAQELKPYSNSRVMILPDNSSSLSYAYSGVSYYDVYGFPYGYQNFLSLFPNLTVFQEIGSAFENGNAHLAGNLLESQDIGAVIVLNTMQNNPITASGTVINGGGMQFGKILNSTSVYIPEIWTVNYSLYVFSSSGSLNQTGSVSSIDLSDVGYRVVNNSAIVTSGLSYESFPVTVNVTSSNYSASYNSLILLNRSSLKYINDNFSNIMFYSSNGNPLYAWISSISNNTANIYLKINHRINQTIYLRIYPEIENKLSGSGFLGEAPQLSGTGTTVLPSSILYSSAVVGVYGYGYSGSVYTMNFTFNPSDFKNVENSNLSNIAFYTYNGQPLHAALHGTAINTSTSATVSISFPGGVPYFQMDSTGGNPYNIFYIGFASKSTDLDALNANLLYTSQPNMDVGYLPYAVRDFGTYNAYDNGKYVFPYFNDYLNEQPFANAWEFDIPVSGYGFLSGLETYAPLAYSNYYLTTLSPGQEGVSYSSIFGGQTASPLYASNNNDSSMMGYYPDTSYINPPNYNATLQQDSTDVGFGSNNSYVAIYNDYNSSAKYTSKTLYSTSTDGFTNYSINYSGNNLQFALNGMSVLNYSTNMTRPNLMLSTVGSGSMLTLYSMVLNSTSGTTNIKPRQAEVFQAYFGGLPLQNPAYANSTIIFSTFSPGIQSGNFKWMINNKTFTGEYAKYSFNYPGNYSIHLTGNSNTYYLTMKIMPLPAASKIIKESYIGTGYYDLSAANTSGLYIWYINGQHVESNSSKLTYNFPYQGYYSVRVFVLNSYGSYNQSFIISIKDRNTLTASDILLLIYNTVLPMIFIAYLVNIRFRSFVNRIFKQASGFIKI